MPAPSIHLRFNPTTHPDSAERVRAWQAAASISSDMQFQPGDISSFAGSIEVHSFGKALLCDMSATPHDAIRNKAVLQAWAHDHIILDVFLEGGFDGHVGGRPTSVGVGDCVLFDLRGTMRIRLRPMRCLAFIMPRALFKKAAGGMVAVDGLVFPAGSPEAGLLGPLLEHAMRVVEGLDETLAADFCASLVTLVAGCATHARPKVPRLAKGAVPPLPRLLRYVERCAGDPSFDIDQLRTHFGLSRTALYRIFAPVGGVAEAIRRCRVERAIRLLKGNEAVLPAAAIAHASGFADSRSLRRALRAVHGLRIEEIRKAHHEQAQGLAVTAPIAALFDSL